MPKEITVYKCKHEKYLDLVKEKVTLLEQFQSTLSEGQSEHFGSDHDLFEAYIGDLAAFLARKES